MSGHFELTGRCNLRCNHCYGLFATRQDTLSTAQVFRILDDLRDCGTLGLVLTGGELFFRKDILDILSYLSEQKFVVRINSNGTLIDEAVVRALHDLANIYRIHISLYSSEPAVHDQITHAPGSYHKTVRALHLLQEAGFDVRINCSVMKSNVDTFQKVRDDIGDPMGIPVHFDSEIFPKDDGGTENLVERLDAQQIQEFMRANASAKTQPYKQKLCKAGFSFFSICEDGSLLPCLKMKRLYRSPLGQLTQRSFREIWQSSADVLSIRETITRELEGCDLCSLGI
nr:radical SAM protein [Oscillochloris sp. ZM17-4]